MSNFQLSEASLAEIRDMRKRFPEGKHKSALIRALHLAQEDNGGWLSTEVMDAVAASLDLAPIEVYEVATFYTMYNLKPVGQYVLEVCHTGPCYASGAHRILSYLEDKLGIQNGETTSDGMFTIKAAECLGACGYAPMMQVGEHYHEFLNEAKIDQFLADCRAGRIALGSWRADQFAK
jgi:NADH-quinone oxidoreductase subunit E